VLSTIRLFPIRGNPKKFFRFSEKSLGGLPKSLLYFHRPASQKGRFAIVTDARRDAVDADGASDEGI
jgi:hypothetical protein